MAYIVETENGEVKSYIIKGQNNPCGCGSNVFHKVNMTEIRKSYGICNSCNKIIYDYQLYQDFKEYKIR